MPLINPTRVNEMVISCLFREDELEDGKPKIGSFIPVRGITRNAGFHPGRLSTLQPEIEQMLFDLPESVRDTSIAQGDSFLNLCNDRNGSQWTSFHIAMEELLLLGIGLGLVDLAPRFMWASLPGGVPYVTVKVSDFKFVKVKDEESEGNSAASTKNHSVEEAD